MWYGVGIDLGTSFTSAAISEPAGTRMVPLSDDTIVPSTAYPGPDGELLTGTNPGTSADDPAMVARYFKRRLGDPTPLLLGGSAYSPAALMAAQLRDVLASVEEFMRAEPGRIVLTCPAIWGPYRREQFTEVLRQAGVSDYRLVTEPEAAATHYSRESRLGNGDVVAVYDLGGGTFDTTILRMREGELEILGTPEGIEHMGGVDFDDALLAHLDDRLDGGISGIDPEEAEGATVLAGIRTSCVTAKEALSTELEVSLSVPLPTGTRTVTVTRSEFEEVIKPAVQLTTDALRRTISSAGLDPEDLSAVLLAGGSSRIPLVSELVRQEFGKPVRVTQNPKFTVALGAAVIAARPEPVTPAPPAPSEPTPLAPPAPQTPLPDADSAAAAPPPALVGAATGPDADTAPRSRKATRKWLVPTIGVALAGITAGVVAIVLTTGGEDTRGLAAQTSHSAGTNGTTETPSPTPTDSLPTTASPTDKTASPDPRATRDGAESTATVPPPSPTSTSTDTEKPPDKNETRPENPAPAKLSIYEGSPVPPYHAFIASESDWGGTEIMNGETTQPGITATTEGGGLRVTWSGELPAQMYMQTPASRRNLGSYAGPSAALVFDVVVHQPPSGGISLQAHCGHPCGAMFPAEGLFKRLPQGEKTTVAVPVSCFSAAGLDVRRVNTPFLVHSSVPFTASFSHIRWEKHSGSTSVDCQPLLVR